MDSFKDALRQHDLAAFMGGDAREQPGTLAQVLLHETAVAWVRLQQTRTTPRQPWAETRAAFGERMLAIARRINEEYNVEPSVGSSPAASRSSSTWTGTT